MNGICNNNRNLYLMLYNFNYFFEESETSMELYGIKNLYQVLDKKDYYFVRTKKGYSYYKKIRSNDEPIYVGFLEKIFLPKNRFRLNILNEEQDPCFNIYFSNTYLFYEFK